MSQAIVKCSDHLQDIGEVTLVTDSLLITFGTIIGPVVAYNTIRTKDGTIYYLLEDADGLVPGQLVRIRPCMVK